MQDDAGKKSSEADRDGWSVLIELRVSVLHERVTELERTAVRNLLPERGV